MIQDTNNELTKDAIKDCMIASMDVEALYPNIDQEAAAKIVKEGYIKSEI